MPRDHRIIERSGLEGTSKVPVLSSHAEEDSGGIGVMKACGSHSHQEPSQQWGMMDPIQPQMQVELLLHPDRGLMLAHEAEQIPIITALALPLVEDSVPPLSSNFLVFEKRKLHREDF